MSEPLSVSSARPALVTGAGRNIGAHLARGLAAKGHPVVLCARRSEEIEAVAREIDSAGGRALAIPADVTDHRDVQRLVDTAAGQFGAPVQVLVNNAVQRIQKPFLEMSTDDWRMVLEVVLTGAFNTVKAVVPGMRKRKWGRIVNFSGLAGQAGATSRASIVTAKSGIIGFTKAVALETAADGITVNAISPGIIATDRDRRQLTGMGDQALAERHYAEEAKRIPIGRMGLIEEVGAACAYLVSDEAAFVTGQVFNVNGGRYM